MSCRAGRPLPPMPEKLAFPIKLSGQLSIKLNYWNELPWKLCDSIAWAIGHWEG